MRKPVLAAPSQRRARRAALRLAPDNVLSAAVKAVAARELFELDFSQVTRYTDGAANGSNDDPVTYSGAVELRLRGLATRFGFERLPRTWAELNGFLDYCEELHGAAGAGVRETERSTWQAAYREVFVRHQPWRVAAFDAYVAGDATALRAAHRDGQVLARLAREFTEFGRTPDER